MLKFTLADKKIKFITHIVSWEETYKRLNAQTNQIEDFTKTEIRECYSQEQKNAMIVKLAERNITAEATEEEKPTVQMLEKCSGKTFNSYANAQTFIETGEAPLSETEILALAITEIFEMISGGVS